MEVDGWPILALMPTCLAERGSRFSMESEEGACSGRNDVRQVLAYSISERSNQDMQICHSLIRPHILERLASHLSRLLCEQRSGGWVCVRQSRQGAVAIRWAFLLTR